MGARLVNPSSVNQQNRFVHSYRKSTQWFARRTVRWWEVADAVMPNSIAITSARLPALCSPTARISTIRRLTGSASTWNGCIPFS